MMYTFVLTLCVLVACHALADYPLQGDWLSKAKNHRLSAVPGETVWPLALLCHSSVHGLAVGLVTGHLTLGVLETVLHALIDYTKCDGRITYNEDQFLHLLLKVAWAWAAVTLPA